MEVPEINFKKYRKCPHCKSTKGFRISVHLGGYEDKEMTFSGKIINVERHGVDDVEDFAHCLDCNKLIPVEYLNMKNV